MVKSGLRGWDGCGWTVRRLRWLFQVRCLRSWVELILVVTASGTTISRTKIPPPAVKVKERVSACIKPAGPLYQVPFTPSHKIPSSGGKCAHVDAVGWACDRDLLDNRIRHLARHCQYVSAGAKSSPLGIASMPCVVIRNVARVNEETAPRS